MDYAESKEMKGVEKGGGCHLLPYIFLVSFD